MTTINNGVPAFPHEYKYGDGTAHRNDGMSLRDYFAAKAMHGMLAYPGDKERGSHHNNNTPDGVATMAYEYADAMLRAREPKEVV